MGGAVIRRLHPSGFGFWGGLGLGILVALFTFGDLARMFTLIAPAEAQFAPSFRLMDGAHNQLATVDHAGRLLVNTGATSGLTDHITSVTHISGAVMIRNTLGTVATLTGTSLDVNCTGCAAATVVEVDHVSSVTHIAGAASLVSRAGTYVTLTGTALDVNCTGCAAASVVAVSHISGAVHIVNSFGQALHFQGLGVPGQAHGGVLTVQGITGGVPIPVSLASGGDAVNVFHQSTIRHISSTTHVAGGVSLISRAGVYATLTTTSLDVNCTAGCGSGDAVNVFHQSTIRHISSVVHVVGYAGAALHIQGLGVPGSAHGGVLTIQGITGMVPLSVALTSGGDAVNVFHQSTVRHISSAVHVVGYAGAALHVQGLGTPGQSHGGVVSIQGVNNGNAVAVGQSLAAWNIAHVTSVTHVRGGVFLTSQAGAAITVTGTALDVNCTGCSAASIVAVTHISGAVHVVNASGAALHIQGLGVPGGSHGGVLTIQGITGMNPLFVSQSTAAWNIAHMTSVAHIYGRVNLIDRAGNYVTVTGGALDVNCTGCSSSATVHISAALHIAGSIQGARLHIQGVGSPGQSHGGVVSIQGVTGMIAVDVSQSVARWTIAHVTSVTHVYGTVSLVSRAGAYATFTSTSLDVNCTAGCSSGGNISHITSVVHVVGYAGAALHMQGIGLPGAAHGGVVSIQGVGGMVAVSVAQSIADWNIAHITSVTHVYGRMSLVGRDGTYITFTGTALDVNCSAGCSAGTPIPHISGSLHIAGTIKGAQFHVTGLGLPGQTHGGVFTIQGVTGMIGMAVYQDTPRWTVAHITSVTHVYGSVSLISRDGTYAGFAGTSVLVAASSAQSGSWSIQATHQGGEWNIRHIGGVIHVSIVSSTHLTGAIHVVGLSNIGSGAPGTYTTQMVCHSTLAIHVAAAAPGLTQIIHLTSTNGNVDQTSWRIYICGIMVVSAHAQGFSLFEGTGTTCSTLKRSLIGSYRPDDSVVLAASGGFSAIAPFPWMATQVAGNNLCIGQTSRSTGTISGVISYRAGP